MISSNSQQLYRIYRFQAIMSRHLGIYRLLLVIALLNLFMFGSSAADIRKSLGTRTPYRLKCNKNDSEITFPNCKDTKIWMMIRHGTRLPSNNDIIGINTILKDLKYEVLLNHQAGRGKLTREQSYNLEHWSSNINPKEQKFLTREGEEEMLQLAHRMMRRFPNAIKTKYNKDDFVFRFTATQRAEESARNFAIGLFGKRHLDEVNFVTPTKIDPILRFYKHCDRWQKEVKRNPKTYDEQKLFGESEAMQNAINLISDRLGLNRTLTLEEAVLIYKMCGFETSWNKHQISPWCYGLDSESIEALEYYHDLKHYWMDAYGSEITFKQACLAVKTMFENFRSKNTPNSTFLFAHSGTLLKVLSHLQLYKPSQHLRADAVDPDRAWKTSDIDCFASNLAFVLFSCEDGDKVLTLHQERVVQLPMCESELCPIEELADYFHESIYNCNYTDMCSLDKSEL